MSGQILTWLGQAQQRIEELRRTFNDLKDRVRRLEDLIKQNDAAGAQQSSGAAPSNIPLFVQLTAVANAAGGYGWQEVEWQGTLGSGIAPGWVATGNVGTNTGAATDNPLYFADGCVDQPLSSAIFAAWICQTGGYPCLISPAASPNLVTLALSGIPAGGKAAVDVESPPSPAAPATSAAENSFSRDVGAGKILIVHNVGGVFQAGSEDC